MVNNCHALFVHNVFLLAAVAFLGWGVYKLLVT
jgi:hypothetical protein